MIITTILSYAIFAVFSACFSVFVHWCIGSPRIAKSTQTDIFVKQGRIFSSYGNWLRKKALQQVNNNIKSKFDWYKPLGACFICFSLWINTVSIIIFTISYFNIYSILIAWFSVSFAVMVSIVVVNKLT